MLEVHGEFLIYISIGGLHSIQLNLGYDHPKCLISIVHMCEELILACPFTWLTGTTVGVV